jgi:dTDP-4-dehydrorhamnose reductase
MRILVVGASGTIGSAVVGALRGRHDLVLASQQKSPEAVDIMDPASIRALFARIGRVDAVVNAAGRAAFKPFS